MNVAALRRRLARRLADLEPEQSSAAEDAVGGSTPTGSADGGRQAEEQPEQGPRIPEAIAFDLARGAGWPRRVEGRALPGRGPLLPLDRAVPPRITGGDQR
jgi:hypothetical protein